tara:strand:+ start:34 stop:699 length:666 start_codon:yes stop_codon:yes gene_type:complete
MNELIKQAGIFLIFSIISLSCDSDKKPFFKLKQGDILFQNTGNDSIENAIKSVTATSFSKNYSHVGMAIQKNGIWFVLEAIPTDGVCQTPLKDFLSRNKTKFSKSQTSVARLDSFYQPYISIAIAYGVDKINTSYDDYFGWDDTSYYCSELVYKMFSSQALLKDSLPFLTHPMTFNDSTGYPMSNWVSYYNKHKREIPEGDNGTNPNLMASSPHIKFVHEY